MIGLYQGEGSTQGIFCMHTNRTCFDMGEDMIRGIIRTRDGYICDSLLLYLKWKAENLYLCNYELKTIVLDNYFNFE